MKYLGLLLIVPTLLLTSCSPKESGSELFETIDSNEVLLGELQHNFTLADGTLEKFEEGLLLLHNFEYDDALTAFKEASAIDSSEVLAHWGEAMCHYKALWKKQNTVDGRAVLSRLGDNKDARLASITDPMEKSMWELVEIMYGEGEFDDRNERITGYMASLHKQYPKHQEIAAFYALSLIWSTEKYGDGSDDLRLAASIADKIIKVNPLHPGALHYKIHALDGPNSAEDAHAAADAYAKVAADAAHALHMPSHIYLALGEWDGVVSSNQESYDASVTRMKKLELKDGDRGYHSLAWLHYGLLQQGRYTEAESILNDMLSYVPNDPTKGARGYLLGMQSRQLAEKGGISIETILDTDIKVEDIGLIAKSTRSYLRAQLAYDKKDTNALDEELSWLATKVLSASLIVDGDGIALCATGNSRYAPTQNDVSSAEVVMSQIKGMKALLEGNENQFESYMQAAVELENKTNFPAGPPKIIKPSFEQYGEWLLTKGKYAEAIDQFDKALKRMPRRSKSLMGKMTALSGLDQADEAQLVEAELKTIWKEADDEVASMIN